MKFELKDRKGLPDWLFLEAAGVKKLFGFFFSIFGFFWRQLAHTVRLAFWLFKCLAEKCY